MRLRELITFIFIQIFGLGFCFSFLLKPMHGSPWLALFGLLVVAVSAFSIWQSHSGETLFERKIKLKTPNLRDYTLELPGGIPHGRILAYFGSEIEHYQGIISLESLRSGEVQETVEFNRKTRLFRSSRGISVSPAIFKFNLTKSPIDSLRLRFGLVNELRSELDEELLVILKK